MPSDNDLSNGYFGSNRIRWIKASKVAVAERNTVNCLKDKSDYRFKEGTRVLVGACDINMEAVSCGAVKTSDMVIVLVPPRGVLFEHRCSNI